MKPSKTFFSVFLIFYFLTRCTTETSNMGSTPAPSPTLIPTSTPTPSPTPTPVCTAGAWWSTVDDFSYASGQNSFAYSIGADRSGNVYAVGQGLDSSSVLHWVVRKSSDHGSTWITVKDVPLAGGQAFASDSTGNIYAGGFTSNSGTSAIVMKSSNNGSAWSTIDNFSDGGTTKYYALAIDSLGVIYTAGQGAHWTVRTSSDAGTTWVPSDAFTYSLGTAAAVAVGEDSNGNHFAAGYGPIAGPPVHWLVRQLASGGSVWSTVDDFSYDGTGYASWAYGLGADSSGNMYVVGQGNDSSVGHWIVRTSNGGLTWRTIDDFTYTGGGTALAFGLDSKKNLYAVGYGTTLPVKVNHWLVRQSGNGTTWNTVDDFVYSANLDSQANAVAKDSSGNLYVAGQGDDTSTVTHWVIRKSPCQ